MHVIRLRNPWQPGSPGEFHRRFGRPTNLDDTERVQLVIDELVANASVTLNGEPLLEPITDVTDRLQPRNELVVRVPAAHAPAPTREFIGTLAKDVRLEIVTSLPAESPAP